MAGGPAAPAAPASSSESSSGTTHVTAAVSPCVLGQCFLLRALFLLIALSCVHRVLTEEVIVWCRRSAASVPVGVTGPGEERDVTRVPLNAPTQAPQVQIRSREPATCLACGY